MKKQEQDAKDVLTGGSPSPYISPRELAERWRCSRTSAQRIANQAGFGKTCLGNGKHASVRYRRADVESYEQARSV